MGKVMRQVITFDGDSGEVLADVTSTRPVKNGGGFVMMYTDKVQKLIIECPSATTLKVFMLLAMGQQYEERGMITTKKAIQDKLGITKKTCIESFKWLKEHFVINESKIDGHTEFMVNPEFVSVGRDGRKRHLEWQRRWQNQVVSTQITGRQKIANLPAANKSRRSIEG